ncbi:hypothetical protein PVAP13_3NG188770 [Panicum virgatum]|uniref:Uncharacterized protein n=1 Tax=Panicum virgatum TaxID=38727 RepID=A0A8T0TVP9_PANVG|nr:hypothetical protein PVAP13_3NG188770 [Panicum virgatum]
MHSDYALCRCPEFLQETRGLEFPNLIWQELTGPSEQECFFTDVAHAAPGLEANMAAAAAAYDGAIIATARLCYCLPVASTIGESSPCDLDLFPQPASASSTGRAQSRVAPLAARAARTPRGRAATEASDGRLVVTRQTAADADVPAEPCPRPCPPHDVPPRPASIPVGPLRLHAWSDARWKGKAPEWQRGRAEGGGS